MIQNKTQYEVTVRATNELKTVLKRLGSSPGANLKEIQKLRDQVEDLQEEVHKYCKERLPEAYEKKPPSITVELVEETLESSAYFELSFRGGLDDYEISLSYEEVEDLKWKLSHAQEYFEGKPST